MSLRRTGQGGVVMKRCQTCHREVLSAYRGEVSAVGKGEILKVDRDGNVHGKCPCGASVVWTRERART